MADLGQFLRDAKAEVRKITWPARKQTIQATIAVVVFVAFSSVFLGLTDLLIGKILDLLLR